MTNRRIIDMVFRGRAKDKGEPQPPMAPFDPWRLQEILEDCARSTGSTITEFKIR